MTQETALTILKTGANVFLTGEPGSGKTYTVGQYVSWLRSHGIAPAITASTGIAATHIGGTTVHSWSGIGIHKHISDDEMDRILENGKLVTRIERTSVLIIDEISMLDSRTFACVDQVCRKIKKPDLAFGGLQVVVVGDFFQLPPVSRADEDPAEFAYASSAWQRADFMTCYLSEQHRQDDADYVRLLSSLRSDTPSADVHERLRSRYLGDRITDCFPRLYAHNVNVDRVNDEKLSELPGDAQIFEMETRGSKSHVERLVKSCLSPEFLSLKIGARVMCTKNHFEKGFVNGTLGDVVGFDEDEGHPIVKTLGGRTITLEPMEWTATDGSKTIAKIVQFPLRLAWAMTIHKSQGLTLDAAVMDLSEAFEYGQGYVALSRVRSLAGLHLLGYNARALQVHPEILDIDAEFRARSMQIEEEFAHESVDRLKQVQTDFVIGCGGLLDTVNFVPERIVEPKVKKKREKKTATHDETLALFLQGKTIIEIAEARSFAPSTIFAHIERLYMDGKIEKTDIEKTLPDRVIRAMVEIKRAFEISEDGKLTPIFEQFGGKYSYDELRLVRMVM